jgi:hypothetical protein
VVVEAGLGNALDLEVVVEVGARRRERTGQYGEEGSGAE